MKNSRPQRDTTGRCQTPWWEGAVGYQIYVRSFADSNGDGMGDLRGIAQRLDYLTWLGVDAIWLTPFYPTSGHDHGYDVSDYCDVSPQHGTLDDFDHLVELAHSRGLKVIVDLVSNHTSIDHEWFIRARRRRDSPDRTATCGPIRHPAASRPTIGAATSADPPGPWIRPRGSTGAISFCRNSPISTGATKK